MGRKSRNKKKKESDGGTGNINGGSNSNNNHNNNISIPTVDETVVATATTTMTMVLTQKYLEHIDNGCKLKGYPKSNDFVIGYKHMAGKQDDLAIDSFKRGAHDGCVPCMSYYAELQQTAGNMHLAVPFYFESAIRGYAISMERLSVCYSMLTPMSVALASLWVKMNNELGDTTYTEEDRKELKKKDASTCFVCGKEETEDNNVTLVKCAICKYYSYCGKDCQTRHWQAGKHMNECRQVILLRKYCKPSYVKEIRDAIMDGQDPKNIHKLQRLRMKLGLNRPKEDYEELLLRLNDDNNNNSSNIIKQRGTRVKIKGLVNASKHNGRFGIVTKVLPSAAGEEGGRRRLGVKLSDVRFSEGNGTVLSIKIENLVIAYNLATMMDTNCPIPHECITARKDGTVQIGSTPNGI